MTGRRSHGRLSALNGVVHQGTETHVRTFFAVVSPPAAQGVAFPAGHQLAADAHDVDTRSPNEDRSTAAR